ncbi:unnamed protein product, partial [Rotaria sp. Silwood2]
VKIPTALCITFALPSQVALPTPLTNVFDSIHLPSLQMPPPTTTTATSIDTQTDDLSHLICHDQQCQTESI